MSFDGPVFRSYGTAIARHIENKGKTAVVINDTSYSNTTSKHYGKVRQAVSGTVFHIGGIARGSSLSDVSGPSLFEYAVQQAAAEQAKASKARQRKEYHLSRSAYWLEQAREINTFFGLRRKVDEGTIARLRKASEAAEKKVALAEQQRQAKEKDEQCEAYLRWIGNLPSGYFNASLFPVAFRVEGEELVSTLGARVPLDAAKVAFRFAMRKRATGWHRNGETCPVGMYHLDAINEQGIVAGCHRISWDELTRLEPVLA